MRSPCRRHPGGELDIHLHDDDLQGLALAPYLVVCEGGATFSGRLDAQGFARLPDVPAGEISISFPGQPGDPEAPVIDADTVVELWKFFTPAEQAALRRKLKEGDPT